MDRTMTMPTTIGSAPARAGHRAVMAALLLLAGASQAQHHHRGGHAGDQGPSAGPPVAATSPYRQFASREIKALSADELAALREGRGMALALPAELHGYPGPLHTLEHARELGLSDDQRSATQSLMQRHQDEARRLGQAVIDAERALDAAFARREADDARVRALSAEVARLRGELRASHLLAHLEQTRLLAPAQVALYQRLRGYATE